MTPPQLVRRLRVSRKSAYAWHARWREDGVEGLRPKGMSGMGHAFSSAEAPCRSSHVVAAPRRSSTSGLTY
ncbi:helix-turn-helix domain-containing protein, partial [Streptomyces avermitilis]